MNMRIILLAYCFRVKEQPISRVLGDQTRPFGHEIFQPGDFGHRSYQFEIAI